MNQLSLPTARATDPATSHAAAASIGKGVEEAVMGLHRACAGEYMLGISSDGLTDDELCDELPGFHAPSLKSARSRLARAGRLRDSGRTRPSNRGKQQIVWELA